MIGNIAPLGWVFMGVFLGFAVLVAWARRRVSRGDKTGRVWLALGIVGAVVSFALSLTYN